MLKSLECGQLINEKLFFNKGLNVLLGPDDGANSIGKSSVLMLIDFAFGGDDFCSVCSDVIENIGEIKIKSEFIFNNISYTFIRNTSDPKKVDFCFIEGEESLKTIDEFRRFLSKYYDFPEGNPSFRSVVNPFFRVWGKDNYNPNRPLDSFPKEPYQLIRTNLLKMFGFYSLVDSLEKNKSKIESKKKTIHGMFTEGFVQRVNQKELRLKKKELLSVSESLNEIKNDIEIYALSVKDIVNKKNLSLKLEKNELEDKLFYYKSRLLRIENNLKFGGFANAKTFEKLSMFFSNVNEEKLLDIEKFHIGISKILKQEMLEEKRVLEEKINYFEEEIKTIDEALKEIISSPDKPVVLVDKLLELSILEKKLRDIVSYAELKAVVDSQVTQINHEISDKTIESLQIIQKKLNKSMTSYIENFYKDHPVHPTIKITESNYEFSHNADTGTGKSHANMISLDLCFLEHTCLPALIHDLILFKNIEVHAFEQILMTYTKFDKQTFIAIDELKRYDKEIIELVKSKIFLELSSDKLAFKKSWKKVKL